LRSAARGACVVGMMVCPLSDALHVAAARTAPAGTPDVGIRTGGQREGTRTLVRRAGLARRCGGDGEAGIELTARRVPHVLSGRAHTAESFATLT